jgi:hypothetical protein
MARERRRRPRTLASSAIGLACASVVAGAPALLVAPALLPLAGCTDGVTPDCSGAAAAACGAAGDGGGADAANDSAQGLPDASADANANANADGGSEAGLDGGDAG